VRRERAYLSIQNINLEDPAWGDPPVRIGTAGRSGAVAEQDRMAGGKRKRERMPVVGDRVRVKFRDQWEVGGAQRGAGGGEPRTDAEAQRTKAGALARRRR
jgi:hypothetical protein